MQTMNQPATPPPPPVAASPRLEQFRTEVADLKVTGGQANPERTWLRLGTAAWIIAIVIEVAAWVGSHNAATDLDQRDNIILATAGLVVAVIGTGLFVTFALTRYLRYWLLRLIYADRESTDRVIDALRTRS
jgi:hypothetical protein